MLRRPGRLEHPEAFAEDQKSVISIVGLASTGPTDLRDPRRGKESR